MTLTATVQISMDVVMQAPGGPEEDERGRFDRGGWAHFDNEAGRSMDAIHERADTFLFGRNTFEVFARTWGAWDAPGNCPIWTALHTKPNYVASTTLARAPWKNTTILDGDLLRAIDALKSTVAGELQVHGSGAPSSAGCSPTDLSMRSTSSPFPSSWAKARDSSQTPDLKLGSHSPSLELLRPE